MQFEDLAKNEATLSEAMSKRAFRELFTISTWRCYSNNKVDVDYWIRRYLTAHAKIPGLITDANNKHPLVYANFPLQLFRWRYERLLGEGFLFANGAVVHLQAPQTDVRLLFVEEKTAVAYRYPNKGYAQIGMSTDDAV